MILYRTKNGVVIEKSDQFYRLGNLDWDRLVNRDDLYPFLVNAITVLSECESPKLDGSLLTPIGRQEIWAAGVTYLRSMEARMKEAEEAGGGTFYDLVYHADRPELFFKSTPGESDWSLGKSQNQKRLDLECSGTRTDFVCQLRWKNCGLHHR